MTPTHSPNALKRLPAAPLVFLAALSASAAAFASGGTGSGGPGGGGGGGGGGVEVFNGVSLKILDAAAPPGGSIQMQVSLTEPKPISIGSTAVPVPPVVGTVEGIVFPGNPDAAGAAVVGPTGFNLKIISPSGNFGLSPTLDGPPIIAVTLKVPATTALGTTASLTLNPAQSLWTDPSGAVYAQQVKPGTFTAQNSLCVTDVQPGGGLVPAGATTTILGSGFQPGSKVSVDGVSLSSTTVVSSNRIDVVTATAAQFDGVKVSVRNPDGTRVNYYSYLRASSLGESAVALLAATETVYPVQPLSLAVFPAAAPNASSFVGLALQNPGTATSQVTVALSTASSQVATTTLTLPPRTELSREASELFSGVVPGPDTVITVTASTPVQMLGLLGDLSANTVTPVLPTVSSF